MKCYYHNDIEAVGICKNCGKAICKESSKEVSGNLFCAKTDCASDFENSSSSPRYINFGAMMFPLNSKKLTKFDAKHRKVIMILLLLVIAWLAYLFFFSDLSPYGMNPY